MLDRILIVDDEPLARSTLAEVLSREGHAVSQAESAEGALALLGREPHALVLCDIRMPGMDGTELLRRVHQQHAGTDVVLMTGFASLDGAIDAMVMGAADYLTKPLKSKEVVARIRAVLQRRHLEAELHSLQSELRSRHDLRNVVAASPLMSSVLAAIQRVKDGREPVLLHGELGSGRRFLARAIHYGGSRRLRNFACVECRTTPQQGLGAALFGETSDPNRRAGALENVGDGTLHVAGLERCPRAIQLELARCIETGTWRKTRGGERVPLAARLVFSTDAPLEESLASGALAPELAALRSAVAVHVPALRQRVEDLPGLVAMFIAEYSRGHGRDLSLGPGASELVAHTEFPGNVAQLFAVLERCASAAVGGVLSIEELARASRPSAPAPHRPIAEHLDEREYQLVLQAVQRNPRRLDQAARELGVSRTTLWRRMRKYGIKLAAT